MTCVPPELLEARETLWDANPIICESAVLPTAPLQDAAVKVLKIARKSRSSIAFCAAPMLGKTSCIKSLCYAVTSRIPGCGVMVLEAVQDAKSAEGRLLLQILKSIRYAHPVDRELAGKRDQVNRALIALAGTARHLFIFIDEAQEFTNNEFAWFKGVINGLARAGIKVTTILFGQRELIQRRDELFSDGRSDLGVRFMKVLHDFLGCRSIKDLKVILNAMDSKSEFPLGTGWSYTQFLMPRAYAAGFRAESCATMLWQAIELAIVKRDRKHGISMDLIAAILANLFIQQRNEDGPNFALTPEMAQAAVKDAVA